VALALLGALAASGARDARAQSVESDVPSDAAHLVQPDDSYAVPDAAPVQALEAAQYEDAQKRFSAKLGLVLMPADYTSFSQDDASRAQVGNQQDEYEPRSLRISARGHVDLWRHWTYFVSYEYKGFDQISEADWNITDARVATEIGPRAGTLTLGRIKEPHSYEMVGDAANLPQHERLLSPFFRSRNVGATLGNTYDEQRGTWTVGWFNDWWAEGRSYSGSGNDFAGRVTWLPVWGDEGARYVHLGASVRYYAAVDDQLRYKGKPASNVADDFVDTGKLAGDHAWHTGLEALWTLRGYSVLAEYIRADVSTRDPDRPTFDGWYVTGSWVVTGEHRPYDRKAGYARRVQPQGHWGAVELIARYGSVDLDDRGVQGGQMDGWWAGVNWWATRRLKASIGYGDIDLDRDGLNGNTRTLLSRVQWIY
jgi:phosphate-selective porin OprO/OprP